MFDFERDYDWRGLTTAAGGAAGLRWVHCYLDHAAEIQAAIKASAARLRARQFEQSRAFLEEADSRRNALSLEHPSVFHAIGRFYFGGLAYYHYCRGEFDKADLTMVDAQRSIVSALEMEPCLLPFAALSLDIPLKRARIARARRRWEGMRHYIRAIKQTFEDARPLCVLFGRQPVYYSTIAALFDSRESYEEKLIPAIQLLNDREARRNLSLELLAQFYTPPEFLISYP